MPKPLEIQLPPDVLRAAVCGVLICKGWTEPSARAVLAHDYDLTQEPAIAETVREVGSVCLTLRSWGWISDLI